MLMGLIKVLMDNIFIVMNLFAVRGATRSAGFGLEPKRNAGFTMMLWQLLIGNALTWHMTSNFLLLVQLHEHVFSVIIFIIKEHAVQTFRSITFSDWLNKHCG